MLESYGFLKNKEELLILQKGTAQSAKFATFFDFLGVLPGTEPTGRCRGLGGSKFLSDIT
jgi:hypothetical protein